MDLEQKMRKLNSVVVVELNYLKGTFNQDGPEIVLLIHYGKAWTENKTILPGFNISFA